MEKVENAGRRVEKFVQNMHGAWEMQNNFEKRMQDLLRHISEQRRLWDEAKFDGTYADAKNQSAEFTAYKRNQKRTWVAERSDLVGLLGNIKTKLSTYRLRPYDPPAHLSLDALDHAWAGLMQAERDRSQVVNETIRDIKNALRKSFADKAKRLCPGTPHPVHVHLWARGRRRRPAGAHQAAQQVAAAAGPVSQHHRQARCSVQRGQH